MFETGTISVKVTSRSSQTDLTNQVNRPYLKQVLYHLERIKSAATMWVKIFGGLAYEERLKSLQLQSFETRRLRNDLALTPKFIGL